MPERLNKVSVVVDKNYGDRLHSLVDNPVWIIDSPANRAAAEVAWQTKGATSVTPFKSSLSSASADCVGILNMIDLHHRAYSVLEVVGAGLDEELHSVLRELGFSKFESTAEGFSASR